MKPMPNMALKMPNRPARSSSGEMSVMYAVATAIFALVSPAMARPASNIQRLDAEAINT